MAENAILAALGDRRGAHRLLDLLGLSLGSGMPVSGGASKLLFLVEDGCWILDELPGVRRAAKHTVEFVALERVRQLTVDLTDAARHSEEAVAKLRGLGASLAYDSEVVGGDTVLDISGSILLDAVRHDDDAIRLWDLVLQLVESCSTAGVPVVVTASSD